MCKWRFDIIVGPIKLASKDLKRAQVNWSASSVTDQTFKPALAAFSNDFNTRAASSSAVILFIKTYRYIGHFQSPLVPTKRKTNASEANVSGLAFGTTPPRSTNPDYWSFSLFQRACFWIDMASMIKQQSLSFVVESDVNASSIKPSSQAQFDDHFNLELKIYLEEEQWI